MATHSKKGTKTVVMAFVRRINEHDSGGLSQLMTEDHLFVDSLGRAFKGRGRMKEGWDQYFELFADYTISITDVFEKKTTIGLFGTARGTYVDHSSLVRTRWEVPAAWKAVVTGGLVSEWHVFADNYETMKLVTGS